MYSVLEVLLLPILILNGIAFGEAISSKPF
mgnify:CR=1 FL=1